MGVIYISEAGDLRTLSDLALKEDLEAARKRILELRRQIVDLRQAVLDEEHCFRTIQDEISRRRSEARAERGD